MTPNEFRLAFRGKLRSQGIDPDAEDKKPTREWLDDLLAKTELLK